MLRPDNFASDVGMIVGNQPVFKAGRLVEFIPMWREITSDPNVLQYVQGVKISFIEGIVPCQQTYRPSVFNGQHMKLSKMRSKVFEMGCSENLTLRQGSFCQPYFYPPRMMGPFV